MWDELASYNVAAHGAQQDQQKLMQFLMGLNESYSTIRGKNPPNESSPFCPPSILLYLSRRNVVPPHFDEHNSGICRKCCYGRVQQRQAFGGLEGQNRLIEHRKNETD